MILDRQFIFAYEHDIETVLLLARGFREELFSPKRTIDSRKKHHAR